ncbi:hypothetical protein P20311_3070 [Pseudoalteromonas sp. BSi20311]|nr:hypothetical protein P20311_3070 [Pseudoalteromonas sp. BSi20311]
MQALFAGFKLFVNNKKPQRVCGFFIANKLKLIIGYLHTSATALAK